ncbi:MAG: ATP-binding protein [Candidatus Acidiferrales bacterium]
MTLPFYEQLVGFTAGTLAYLFLLALILGHRRPRLFERLLFFVCLALFLIYSGGLLADNANIEYGMRHPRLTYYFYMALTDLGMFLLPPLVWHTHVAYRRQVRKASSNVLDAAMTWVLYLVPAVELGAGIVIANGEIPGIRIPLFPFFYQCGVAALPAIAGMDFVLELRELRSSTDRVERRMFQCLFAISGALAILLALQYWFPHVLPGDVNFVFFAIIAVGILPGAVLAYFFARHNVLEFGAQRNLMYALPVTLLGVLYLAFVRRVGGWLQPVVPPEATAAVMIFVLIVLFEPLERVIGPMLHRQFQSRMGGVQRLSVELQQEARQGNVSHLVAAAERRIREEFGLAAVRLAVPRDPGLKALESPGGLGHVAQIRLMKDGQELGLLEAASTGSYLTGETTAALEFLAEQLPGMVDLARLIEEKLRLERELAERERMASLGQMAANVSHNLRNPLSSMKTVLQVQLENPDLPLDVRRDCALVVNEIDRMSAKLTQLLRYAKPSTNGQRVAAVALANQTAVLFRHDAEQRNVRLEFERPTTEIFAVASEDGLSEVLSNLIVNALEAQPEGGRVRVSLARTDGRLEIIVDDDGPGITPELRAKIFQPYFTTKATGTGLGLSIVARRIDEMGGTMACESPLRGGRGTRFRLILPLAEGEGA